MTTSKRPIAIDLFAGAGGMSLGFEQAGFDVAIAVEIDRIHCATHEYNFPKTSVICKSVAELQGKEIQERLKNAEIDVLFGGPPCQGFSLMGKRVLEDPRNQLGFHFVRLIGELQPKYFVMENVPGMGRGKHQQLLIEIIAKLKSYGYEVVENYQILNAAYFGVPQNRERMFLIGCKKGLTLPKYPEITHSPKPDLFLEKTPTAWEAIQDLPNIENYPELETRDWVEVTLGIPSHYGKILRGLLRLDSDHSYPREYDRNILNCSSRTQHFPESIARFAAIPPGKFDPISHLFKIDPSGLCNTLRAGTATALHPYQTRCITVREAARLHSYPDWFRFHNTKS